MGNTVATRVGPSVDPAGKTPPRAEKPAMAGLDPFAGQILALQRQYGNRHVSRLIQRWDGPEHREIGDTQKGEQSGRILLDSHKKDLPERTKPVNEWPKQWRELYEKGDDSQKKLLTDGLTYGEIVGLSGDLYKDFDALNRAPLRELYDLVPLIRKGGGTGALEKATGGRYLTLAKENESHFSNVPMGKRNIDLWNKGHAAAIVAAQAGDANRAWALNAAADHYLTDAFSGGHIRVKRHDLHAKGKIGDVQSKAQHDLDNENGVEVHNGRGDVWIAYGDNMLNDSRNAKNRKLVEEAVVLSKKDIADALAQRAAYKPPADGMFEAEKLVPHALAPGDHRWNAWDKTKEYAGLVKDELPGIVAGMFVDDNRVRAWVRKQPPESIGRQSVADRARMINVMLSGATFDDDEQSILRILQASVAAGDQVALIDTVGGYKIIDSFNGAEETKLRNLYRASYYGFTNADHAFKMTWSCIDGRTSEWEESMIADILELNPARRTIVEMIGRRAGGGAKGADRDFRNGMSELRDQLDGYDEKKVNGLFPGM
jgi:hypothetical protein